MASVLSGKEEVCCFGTNWIRGWRVAIWHMYSIMWLVFVWHRFFSFRGNFPLPS